jgi:phospholipid/cholesterol/gamma-HCH transport system substrate-binding protein
MNVLTTPLKERNPFLLGVVAATIVAALVLAALAWGLLGLGRSEYRAEFANTGELSSSNEVRIAGLRVGEVTSVGLEGDHVLVTFRVDRDVHLGSATGASIKMATLLGTRYLELTPAGTGSLPGNRIPLAHTTVPYNLQDVLQNGTPIFQQVDANTLRQSLAAVADTLNGKGPQIGAALDGLSRLSGVVLARRDQVSQLIENMDAVSNLVDHRSDQLFGLMTQSNTLLNSLLRRQQTIRDLLGDAKRLTDQLGELVHDNRPEVRPLLHNAEQLTGLLRQQDDAVNRALAVIGTSSRYLTNTVGTGPYMDAYFPYSLLPDSLLCQLQAISGCR